MSEKGRPAGSKNRDYDQADAVSSCCARCQSTKRTAYGPKQVVALQNTFEHRQTKKPYNRIVFRPTQCLDCGQWRRDRSYEFQK